MTAEAMGVFVCLMASRAYGDHDEKQPEHIHGIDINAKSLKTGGKSCMLTEKDIATAKYLEFMQVFATNIHLA